MPAQGTPGLIIAAPASGAGKTTVTLGLLRHLSGLGRAVGSFKVGPDYIDPAFHEAATGRPCPNLDLWAMRDGTVAATLAAVCADADVVIGEGVMGLFDGAPDGRGSTADVSARTGWPVVLVADVRAQGDSAAALVHGFASFREDVRVAGVIFNRAGSVGHERLLRRATKPLGIPVLGCLPADDTVALPSRHLGLVQAREHGALDGTLDACARLVAKHIDVDAFLDAAAAGPAKAASARAGRLPVLGQRTAVARDDAFAFAYPHLLAAWRDQGVELSTFSPLANEAPAADADAVFLPGGYPELHAGRLAGAETFRRGLSGLAKGGAAIYGECGGYMVLGEGLVDGDGRRHAMAGLLPAETSFAEPRLHLGYRRMVLAADCALGRRGARLNGHEFHYAAQTRGDGEALFQAADALGAPAGPAGLRAGTVFGSFLHLIDSAEG